MSSAGTDRLLAIHSSLTTLIQDWVGIVVGEDDSPETTIDVLGSLQAMKELTRRVSRLESRVVRLQQARDQLVAKNPTLDPSESNRLRERLDDIQTQLDRLTEKRDTQIENLASLSALLQGGEG